MISQLVVNHLNVTHCRLDAPQWVTLFDLVRDNPIQGISLYDSMHPNSIDVKEAIEVLDTFWYSREIGTPKRLTFMDAFGIIGVASLNLKDSSVILTEGVSDFITMKLCYPNSNVLGFTTLSGNRVAKSIVLSLFDSATIISDNDFQKEEGNTGILNAFHIKDLFMSFGKKATIEIPEYPYKDITQLFINQLRLQRNE